MLNYKGVKGLCLKLTDILVTHRACGMDNVLGKVGQLVLVKAAAVLDHEPGFSGNHCVFAYYCVKLIYIHLGIFYYVNHSEAHRAVLIGVENVQHQRVFSVVIYAAVTQIL